MALKVPKLVPALVPSPSSAAIFVPLVLVVLANPTSFPIARKSVA